MTDSTITKSEIIDILADAQPQFPHRDVVLAVKSIIDHMRDSLIEWDRIEIRGFGSFSLHHRASRLGRNPKTGAAVQVKDKYVPHFKPGKEFRDRVDFKGKKQE